MKRAFELAVGCCASCDHMLLDVPREDVAAASMLEELVATALPGLRVVRVSCSAQTTPEDIPSVVAGSSAHGRTRRTSLSKGKSHLPQPSDGNKRATAASGDGLPSGVAHLRIAHVVFLERLHLVARPLPLLQALLDVLSRRKLPLHGSSIPVPAEAFTVVLVLSQPMPLPMVLLDQFLLRVSLPNGAAEVSDNVTALRLSVRDLVAMRERISSTFVHLDVRQYMREIVVRLRNNEQTAAGTVTPRAVQMLEKAVRLVTVLNGCSFATPSNVLQVASLVLAHRIAPLLSPPNYATAAATDDTAPPELVAAEAVII